MVMKYRKRHHEVLKGNLTGNFPGNCEQTPPNRHGVTEYGVPL